MESNLTFDENSISIRWIGKNDTEQQFLALLNSSFSVPEGCSFFDDFPVWSSSFKLEYVWKLGLFLENQLVACAGIRIAQMKNAENKPISCALIGAVATHIGYRQRGLGSRIVGHAVEWAKQRGAEIVFLWGSEHSMYQKLGFQLCGQQVRIPIGKILDGIETRDSISVSQGWVTPGLFQRIQRREGGLVLEDKDRSWFEAHKNVQWFYTGSPEHPEAYAGLGRGIDLKDIIHEWGGPLEHLLEIFEIIHKKNNNVEVLAAPKDLEFFRVDLKEVVLEYLCLAKALKPETLSVSFPMSHPIWIWGLDAS